MSLRNGYNPQYLAAAWKLQNAAGVITPEVLNRYPGTLVNAPTWGVGPFGGLQCIELDGNNTHVVVGDILELNAVDKFTICFWMNQGAIDAIDYIFDKNLPTAALRIMIHTWNDGNMYFRMTGNTDGHFDYSTVVFASSWHHVCMVFDGGQVGDANRLVAYIDGVPVALTFVGPIPAITGDMSGTDAHIGYSSNAFDGRLWDMRIYQCSLSRDEVNKVIHGPVPYQV